jgi:uncharacterized protein YjbJ (UPF0337 family)
MGVVMEIEIDNIEKNAKKAITFLEANWHILKGKIKNQWAALTDNDLIKIDGSREKLIGEIMKKYDWSFERAEREVSLFTKNEFEKLESKDNISST